MLFHHDEDSATPDADRDHALGRGYLVICALTLAATLLLSWLSPLGFAPGL